MTYWYCDVCGERIERSDDWYVIWKTGGHTKAHGFKIVHNAICDPGDADSSVPLADFLGTNGLTHLPAHISVVGPVILDRGGQSRCGAADLDEFVDLIRRLQTPYYEEARRKFDGEEFKDDIRKLVK